MTLTELLPIVDRLSLGEKQELMEYLARGLTAEHSGYSWLFLTQVVGSWAEDEIQAPDRLPPDVREEIQWPTY